MSKKLLHRSEITRELVDKWIAECGSPSEAAKRHYSEIEHGRYPGSPCTYNGARNFMADVLSGGAPAQHVVRNASEEASLNRIRELLLAANVPLEHIGRIKNVKLTSLGVKLRHEDGSETLTSKYNTGLVIEPTWATGPKWPVVQPAPKSTISYIARPPVVAGAPHRVFMWPDTQIGFHRLQTGKLAPMHDLAAIDVALQMLASFRADEVVIMGDFLDLTSLSRWLQVPEFQAVLQPAINYAYTLLGRIRAIVGPKAKISYIAGNHERRLSEYIAKNAVAAHGLRSAEKDMDKLDPATLLSKEWDWPALSVPKVLELQSLNIAYSAEYPGGEVWIGKRNVFVHAPDKTAARELRANVYHGHIPKVQESARTIHHHPDDGTEEFTVVAIPGLMRTDEVEELSSLSRSSTASSMSRLNWQQGVGTLVIFDDKHEKHEIGRIKGGWGCLGERQFTASVDKNGAPIKARK